MRPEKLPCSALPGIWIASIFIPRYEVYRGYIVFAFSVIMFVCLSVGLSVCWFVCLSVNFFSVKDFSATTWVRILKFGTKLDSDELYCVTKEQPHIAYQSLYLFIFLSLQLKFLSHISQLLLEPVFSNFVYTFRKAKCTVLLEIKMLIFFQFFIFSFFHSYIIYIDIFFCQRFLSNHLS